MRRRQTLFFLLFACWMTCILSTCKKQDEQVPNAYVDIYIDASSTIYSALNNIGGYYVYEQSGNRGILIYRKSFEEFVAFDRTCTYDPSNPNAIIEVEASGLSIIDSVCGSRFLIIDGSVVEGPATVPLRQYRTSFNGNILHIFN